MAEQSVTIARDRGPPVPVHRVDDGPYLICFDAFDAFEVGDTKLDLPPEWTDADEAMEMTRDRPASPGCSGRVAVDPDGTVIGSGFLALGGAVAGIGPLSVDPSARNSGGGTAAEGIADRQGRTARPGIRARGTGIGQPRRLPAVLLHRVRPARAAGSVPHEQLTAFEGYAPPTPATVAGFEVRPMADGRGRCGSVPAAVPDSRRPPSGPRDPQGRQTRLRPVGAVCRGGRRDGRYHRLLHRSGRISAV
ncbi:hypothetical protein SSCG_02780 [Streptomyces clavuligerus]|nr:hypothetical protein SSCG_02780 [Streptomyces clavuligerus]